MWNEAQLKVLCARLHGTCLTKEDDSMLFTVYIRETYIPCKSSCNQLTAAIFTTQLTGWCIGLDGYNDPGLECSECRFQNACQTAAPLQYLQDLQRNKLTQREMVATTCNLFVKTCPNKPYPRDGTLSLSLYIINYIYIHTLICVYIYIDTSVVHLYIEVL